MTLDRIKRIAVPIEFDSCLELGPGHGTWTKEVLASHQNAHFDLIEKTNYIKERKRLIGSQRDRKFLSAKDLCALPFIDKLISMGVDSFKIEGRGRSVEYVKVVTSVCFESALCICHQ